ncbi:MAG: Gfo/Idh/MocA family oxidoreductase [Candidatus Paceibacterota bacterium]|jgi:predicted dehydrogenase
MKILITGCGSIGMRHLKNFKRIKGCEVSVFRTSCDNVLEFEKEHGVKVFSDFAKALDEKPDGVVISNPTSLHIKYATEAAKRGCGLLIEKPISHDLKGVANLIKIIEKKKLAVLVGCNLRFHRHLIKIKEILGKKTLGKIYFARLSVGSFLPQWRPGRNYSRSYSGKRDLGGGVVLDLIHEIDYALWLFGDPVGINANVCKLSDLEIETEDYAEIFLKFKTGISVQIHMDYLNRFLARECEIVGELGNIKWNYATDTLEISKIGSKIPQKHILKNYDRNEMYMSEIRHFLSCIGFKAKPAVTIYDGKRALEVALAAKKIGKNNLKKI